MYFVLFGCIWDSLVALQNLVQNGTNWCKSSCPEVGSEFFITNTPDPIHWTQNSCFGVFSTLWMLGMVWLPYKTQCKRGRNGSKVRVAKSRHNFSQRTHRINPLGPKLTFWCVLYYLGAFGTVLLPYKTRCKMSRSGAKVRAMKSCQNFSQRTHPIHPIGPKTHVS